MNTAKEPSDDQAALWNGAAGVAWVEAHALLDRVLKPFAELLVEAVQARAAQRVLDVGCGTGGTTLAIARSLVPGGHCVGIDISAPMIAAARARVGAGASADERGSTAARFICADAEVHAFEPAAFDMIVSRFGVMFFGDPVRAFANLHVAASVGAALELIAWRSAADNPFMTAAERAAAPLLPDLPPRRPDAPGQFAFADRNRVMNILEQSGWTQIEIRPIDAVCTFPRADLVPYLTRLGPVGRALEDADEVTRQRIVEAVLPAFAPFVHGDEVRFSAACWGIGARVAAKSGGG